jgi:hypothetical protein
LRPRPTSRACLHRDEIAYILEHSGSAVVVTDDEHVDDVQSCAGTVAALRSVVVAPGSQWAELAAASPIAIADCGPDDAAWLFCTSGITGRLKHVRAAADGARQFRRAAHRRDEPSRQHESEARSTPRPAPSRWTGRTCVPRACSAPSTFEPNVELLHSLHARSMASAKSVGVRTNVFCLSATTR